MVTPNQDPSSLKGTMTTKQATLYDPTGKGTVVDVGSQKASQLQKQGYTLNKQAPKQQPGVQQPSQPFMDMGSFGTAMNEMRAKLGQNNDLMEQKKKLLMQLYDRPLTAEEKKTLTPSQQLAIEGNHRNLIDMEVRLVNDTIQGRTNTLDSSIKYITDVYSKEQERMDNQKKEATDNVMKFISDYGSQAKQAMTALYGADKVAQLEKLTGIDLTKASTMPQTVAEKKISGAGAGAVTSINIPSNTLAGKNNNPGNLRFVGQAGATQGQGGFARFNTPEEGFNALKAQIDLDKSRNLTVAQFVSKYAPPKENDTKLYIKQFNDALGTTNNSKISGIDTQQIAEFMAMKESGTKIEKSETDAQQIADAIINGEQPPVLTGLYGKGAAVKAELARRGFNLTKATLDYNAMSKYTASINSATQLRLRQSVQFVVDSIPLVRELVSKWKSGNYPPLNKAKLTAAKNGLLGPEAQTIATQLDTQINDMAFEMGTAYKGGNSSTDTSLKQAGEQLKSDWSEAQLNGNLDLLERNMKIRLGAIDVGAIKTTGDQKGEEQAATVPTAAVNKNDPLGIR